MLRHRITSEPCRTHLLLLSAKILKSAMNMVTLQVVDNKMSVYIRYIRLREKSAAIGSNISYITTVQLLERRKPLNNVIASN